MMNAVVRLTGRVIPPLALLIVGVFARSSYGAEFRDAFHASTVSYLITPVGEVYAIRPGQRPEKAFVFHNSQGLPYHWAGAPTGFVQWRSEWFVADGSSRLTRFHEDGSFDAIVILPFRVPRLAATGDAIWALNLAAGNSAEQLWRSTDGHTFSPHATGASHTRFDSPANNLVVLIGSSTNEVYVASIVGPPVVHRIWPLQARADIHVAYSRSSSRAGMEDIFGPVDDVTPYSLPLRDLFPLPDGGVAVLRNREDIRGSTQRLELLKGRRADRYDRAGNQTATAVFSRSVHWLTSVTSTAVTGVSKTGDIVVATWGKAVPGEIVAQ